MTSVEKLRTLDVGMRIIVSNRQLSCRSEKYADIVDGAKGIVTGINMMYGKVAVRLKDAVNDLSASGDFFFKPHELEILDEHDNVVEENNMPKITNYLNTVKVKYAGNTNPCTFSYANFDPNLAVNDVCIVKEANTPFRVATVVEINDVNDNELFNEVVAKVDMTDYDFRVSNRIKAAKLKAKMEERAKQLQDVALYQMLANDDPDMMKLLKEYQSLPTV